MSRHRDTSRALTEVRTVRSRALSGIDALRRIRAGQEDGQPWYGEPDPDHDRIIGALNEVVALLDEWQRSS